MFAEMLEAAVGLSDGELDAAIRATELELRRLHARQAALVAVVDERGSYRADGHRSMGGYLRATCNASNTEIARLRNLADVTSRVPEVGEALAHGHVGVSQVQQLARIHANPRTRSFLPAVAPVYLGRAEHAALDDLRADIDQFLQFADQDGALRTVASDVEHRTANVHDAGGSLHLSASGGDPLTAAQMVVVFEQLVERELRRDIEARRVEHGDDADARPLPRTAAQRRFDALTGAIVAAARAPAAGERTITTTVDVLIDHRSLDEAFAGHGVLLAGGDLLDPAELDDDTIDLVIRAAAADPTGWLDRRCETTTGRPVPPVLALRAAMTGLVRRVVVDSDGVVIDHGRTRRLFAGPAREAAMLLVRRCEHPGCTIPVRLAEVDHLDEWHEGGRTDQRNAGIRCRPHNRFKHRERWRTRRDATGRRFSIRADGTVVLPVGARPPDLSADELARVARDRLAALRQTRRS